MGAKNCEQAILPGLRQVKALRLLPCRRGFRCDLLKLPQALRCCLIARIPTVLHSLQPLTELPVDKARVVLGQLAGKESLQRGCLVRWCWEFVELGDVVLIDLKDRERLRD